MAKHEITIHENTGATKASAPYLGSYIAKETLKLADFAAVLAAKCGLPAIQVQAILAGAFDAIETLEAEALTRIHLDGFTVAGVIKGAFPSADAAFDPAKNSLELTLRLDDDIRNTLADQSGHIATDGIGTRVRVDNIVDVESPRPYNVVYGQNRFRVQGFNLVMSDEGAEIYLQNAMGTKFACVVDEVVSKQLVIVHTAELLEPGDYKVVVKSRGGDAEGQLQTSFRKVKYLKVASNKPRIAKGYPPNDPSRVGVYVLYGGFTLEGERLTGGTLKLKYSTDGVTIQEVELVPDTYAVTDTKIDLTPNAISDYIEMSHTGVKPVLTVTTPEGSASYEFTSSGD